MKEPNQELAKLIAKKILIHNKIHKYLINSKLSSKIKLENDPQNL